MDELYSNDVLEGESHVIHLEIYPLQRLNTAEKFDAQLGRLCVLLERATRSLVVRRPLFASEVLSYIDSGRETLTIERVARFLP